MGVSFRPRIAGIAALVVAGLMLAGCQQSAAPSTSASAGSTASAELVTAEVSPDATADVPEPFASGTVKVAVVRHLNAGDVFESWIAGVQSEADKLGIELDIYNANGDNAKQALYLDQAIASNPDAILVGWGSGESLQAGFDEAAEADIPIVTYYVSVPPSENVTTLDQGDESMMTSLLDAMKEDTGGSGKIMYAYVPGYEALDNRNVAFEEFMKENPDYENVSTVGVINANTAKETADQVRSALTANPDVTAIIAPYDEFAKGATLGVQQAGLQDKVRVYGLDISTADIGVMTAAGSPWVLTGAVDQANVGRVAIRAVALRVADQLTGNHLTIPPVFVESADLVAEDVKNMDELYAVYTGFDTPELLNAPWMDAAK